MRITEEIKASKLGKILLLNGIKYQLQVYKGRLLGWIDVDIEELEPMEQGWKITGSWMGLKKTDIVPKDTVNLVIKNLGKDEIELGGVEPKKLKKINDNNKKVMKEMELKKLVNKVLNEAYQEHENYMFFSNLKQIMRQCKMLLEMDPQMIDEILQNGHDWADDHVTEAKTNMDQVFDFFMNEKTKMEEYIEYEDLSEGRKKTGTKLCARGEAAAKAKFKVYPSAYSSGYGVQVCKGSMPGLDGKKRCSPPYC